MEILCLRAAVDIDFSDPGTPRVTFNTSSTSGTQQCINIYIIDDMVVEGQQSIVAQFDTASETPLGQIDFSPEGSQLTVVDNDGNVHDFENKATKFVC